MITYSDMHEVRAKNRTMRNGWAWHSVSCVCPDCLEADWAFLQPFRFPPPENVMFEVKR